MLTHTSYSLLSSLTSSSASGATGPSASYRREYRVNRGIQAKMGDGGTLPGDFTGDALRCRNSWKRPAKPRRGADDAGGVSTGVAAASAAAASTEAESAGAAAAGFGGALRTGRGRVRRAFGRASGAGTDVDVTSAVNSGSAASPRGGSVQLAAVPLRRAAARRRSDRGVSTTTLQTLRNASASGDTGDRRTSGAGGGSTGF